MSPGMFRFAKNMKLLIEGEIRCITRRIFLEHFVVWVVPDWSNLCGNSVPYYVKIV